MLELTSAVALVAMMLILLESLKESLGLAWNRHKLKKKKTQMKKLSSFKSKERK